MNVTLTCYGFGLCSNDTGHALTATDVTQITAGTPDLRNLDPLRPPLPLPILGESLVAACFKDNRFESKPAMEFARCFPANRYLANDSYRTNVIGKVASYESPHCI